MSVAGHIGTGSGTLASKDTRNRESFENGQ